MAFNMTDSNSKHQTNISSNRIAAVIVTYNRLTALKDTVERTLAEAIEQLIIINNASTDGTREWLDGLSSDSRITAIHLPLNVGGAGGFHHGFDHVLKHTDADWLVCFDDDAYPQPGSIARFKSLTFAADVAGVAAAVYLPDGRISEMNRPSHHPFGSVGATLKTLLRRRSGFHVRDEDYRRETPMDIDFSSFVGCFLRVSAIRERIGLPRKELFIYADDIMYTHTIGEHGLRHCFAPMVRFTHDCATLQAQQDVYKPMWKVYYTYRNRLELFRQIAGPWAFPPIAMLKLLSWVLKARHYEQRGVYLRLLGLAWADGMLRRFSRPHTEILRRATP
jgi:GT2 family glycosyltransferase